MTIVYMFFYFYISKKWYKAKIHTYNKYIQNYTNEHSKCYFFFCYIRKYFPFKFGTKPNPFAKIFGN